MKEGRGEKRFMKKGRLLIMARWAICPTRVVA